METTNKKKIVEIDSPIMGVDYCGKVAIDCNSLDVDLLGLCDDNELYYRTMGVNAIKVQDYLKGIALRKAFLQSDDEEFKARLKNAYREDRRTSILGPASLFVPYRTTDSFILKTLAFEFEGKFYYDEDCHTCLYRDESNYVQEFKAPSTFWNNLFYCPHCNCYVHSSMWNDGRGMCEECAAHNVIEGYCDSHKHNKHPIYHVFNKQRNSIYACEGLGDFRGLGFELEVDCDDGSNNNYVACNLAEACGLEKSQVRFARDGSLNEGFEIITQPHTIRAFWACTKSWEKMLKYLQSNGYTSHDAGTCGLHIHISRQLLGKTQAEQDRAIAKIYSFYNDNWSDLARASRRNNFTYCEKNPRNYLVASSKYLTWKKSSKGNGGHYVALNNSNQNTFEFRLGRGTLNSWSFFSWIDLTLTIAKNARRISINKIETNDVLSWLGGIKESTAKYLYKRGAFRSYVLELFPSIAWEFDNSDND